MMPEPESNRLALRYTSHLPLLLREVQDWPAEELEIIHANNENALYYYILVDEMYDTSRHAPRDENLERIETKLNLLIELVGRYMEGKPSAHVPRPVELRADALVWQEPQAQAFREQSRLVAHLKLHPAVPFDLQLPGTLTRCQPRDSGVECEMVFSGLSPAVTDMLEKMIFRQHRRQIAQHKSR